MTDDKKVVSLDAFRQKKVEAGDMDVELDELLSDFAAAHQFNIDRLTQLIYDVFVKHKAYDDESIRGEVHNQLISAMAASLAVASARISSDKKFAIMWLNTVADIAVEIVEDDKTFGEITEDDDEDN